MQIHLILNLNNLFHLSGLKNILFPESRRHIIFWQLAETPHSEGINGAARQLNSIPKAPKFWHCSELFLNGFISLLVEAESSLLFWRVG